MNLEAFARSASGPVEASAPLRPLSPISATRHRIAIAATIAADLIAVAIGFVLPALLRFTPSDLLAAAMTPGGICVIGLGALLWVGLLSAQDAYAPRTLISGSDQVLRVVGALLPAWVLTHLLAFLVKLPVPFESRLVVGLSLPAVFLSLLAARLGFVQPLARRAYRRLCLGPILVIGDTDRAQRLAQDLEERDARSRLVVTRPLANLTPRDAGRLVEEHGFGEVVIEPNGMGLHDILDVAFACLDQRAEVKIISNRFQVVMGRSAIGDHDGVPVMRFRRFDLSGPEQLVKRVVDVIGASIGLLLLAPVLIAIAVAVKLSSPGPVLFRQPRIGRGGRQFAMYKFRTMVDGNDSKVHENYLRNYIRDGAPATVAEDGTKIYKLTEDPRVTRVGAWLRALSLDELPQLWNVVRGDMSLVGPRPCLPYEWDLYRPWQRRRLDVLPGCTGLWQVTARSHSTRW
ncbi:MAG: sugar transferase [Candidatus Eisenbacteria bacterium]|uniref:Sugar transferase n=1 Tax=Eiseniibacteriota bacterium TaxID=2212470 RepID=A0A538TPN0_UNCEI|nr:MAG: sugar transferase [Candidatus Eisenbacteria bacterium]